MTASSRTVEPIPLWRHDQRLAMVLALMGIALLLSSAVLAVGSYRQLLKAELEQEAEPAGEPLAPSSSSPTST
jgi:hypothetical protein